MRPDERRPHRLHQGKSRVRILLKKNAGWLPGFPVEVRADAVGWRVWPWDRPGIGETVWLDRQKLSRLQMTLTKLRHHFPHALPQIVEDVDDWLARMDCLLDALKGAVHQQRQIDVDGLLAPASVSTRWIQRYHRLRAA